jgi:hypothetical protein
MLDCRWVGVAYSFGTIGSQRGVGLETIRQVFLRFPQRNYHQFSALTVDQRIGTLRSSNLANIGIYLLLHIANAGINLFRLPLKSHYSCEHISSFPSYLKVSFFILEFHAVIEFCWLRCPVRNSQATPYLRMKWQTYRCSYRGNSFLADSFVEKKHRS